MLENFDVARANRDRQHIFVVKKIMGIVIISNLHSNPQCMMSCATSAYFGSPRGLVSCCNTYQSAFLSRAPPRRDEQD
jgi:hypothetical protein